MLHETSLDRETSGTPWYGVTDQSKTSFVGSLSWFATPHLSIRASYEFGAQMTSQNACPPAQEACTLVALREQGDMESFQLVIVPEIDIKRQYILICKLRLCANHTRHTRAATSLQLDRPP